MNVHVIISTHNGANWIEKCINSVLNSSIGVHINIIDNVSTDQTVDIIQTKFPEVNLICNEIDLGFAKSNNILLRKAIEEGVDYVFLLNQDAWIEKDTIEGLIKIHLQNKQYGIVSPIHVNGAGTALDFNFSTYCREYRCPGFLSDLYLNTIKEIYDLYFVNAAMWLVSKECMQKVGLFDPLFNVYGEDVDYMNRSRLKGFKLGLAPYFRGYHDREKRPPSVKHNRLIAVIKQICILKDLNNNFYKEVLIYTTTFVKTLAIYLIRGKFDSLGAELKGGRYIFSSLGKIRRTRKICNKDGAYIQICPTNKKLIKQLADMEVN
ncbi:glycosyltransferase family 2 protein [Arcticibacter eurypsychrophilus]|uniref:glycosyltransferase family 2 protein n=1 Tax=Arcticibacter eurypsychrophilus TaxID=1434752 RepID=UPI00084D498E|nr:glycosyltransferase family 2 protein [Arcticibacter eurypsychrophilus]